MILFIRQIDDSKEIKNEMNDVVRKYKVFFAYMEYSSKMIRWKYVW